jgi:hypothetical protein
MLQGGLLPLSVILSEAKDLGAFPGGDPSAAPQDDNFAG